VSNNHLLTGKSGEDIACDALRQRGYRILARNHRTAFGEIDIVGFDRDVVCFIEVKTRTGVQKGLPAESVHAFKQRQIARAALQFLQEKKLFGKKARFDVVSVLRSEGNDVVRIIPNAFELPSHYVT